MPSIFVERSFSLFLFLDINKARIFKQMEPPPRMGVYTILTESRHLRIRNVPNIADISGELELICQQFAPVLTFTLCPEDPLAEIYTQTFLLSTTTYLEAK